MNHYERLEVIKAAYKAKARRLHPDAVPPEKRGWAEAEFKKLNEAHAILSNPQNRTEYDKRLIAEQRSGRSADSPWMAHQPTRVSAKSQARRLP